ncbi:hypothetical protein HPN42_17235 [Klebsiella pneumoniae]|nr:hypothetical protein [Klebsiella pneumoniae]
MHTCNEHEINIQLIEGRISSIESMISRFPQFPVSERTRNELGLLQVSLKEEKAYLFITNYCNSGGISAEDFYERFVCLLDDEAPSGFAVVSKDLLSLKSHIKLYAKSESEWHMGDAIDVLERTKVELLAEYVEGAEFGAMGATRVQIWTEESGGLLEYRSSNGGCSCRLIPGVNNVARELAGEVE